MKIILKFDVQIITLVYYSVIIAMTACFPNVSYCCLYVLVQNYIGYLYDMCISLCMVKHLLTCRDL
jgi:hypothetical protein